MSAIGRRGKLLSGSRCTRNSAVLSCAEVLKRRVILKTARGVKHFSVTAESFRLPELIFAMHAATKLTAAKVLTRQRPLENNGGLWK